MRRLHLIRPGAPLEPVLADTDTVVYIEANGALRGHDSRGRTLDADALLDLIFQHRVVVTW